MLRPHITPRILAGLLPLLILLVIRDAADLVFRSAERLGDAANDVATRLGLWMRLDSDYWE
ncbi:hypothetical protein VQ02_33505 [Methylobacterium variabile]|uniref:Uncharacterized protein n=1 Tax=Methylobacterium variabile TaxID=298794 RepID=A0A0J6S126_9HYPH|nr:hypothetical protein [Methylobacterium variabile]KMO27267.1 hypothetical protein VQ02_33505 [Methylobacterium variabile]